MLLSFGLISASLKQVSRNINNDIIGKQNIFGDMQFLSNSKFHKILLKKATTETSWQIIVLTSSILLNSSFYIYIYIYIYICIHTERESIQQEINFISKSFWQCFYQLHICIKILLQLSNLYFSQILIFHYYRNGNTNIKKLAKRQLR